MTYRSLSLPILAAAVTTLAASAPALAVHKNWVLRNAGGQCAFTVPGNDTDNHTDGTFNAASYARFASCPVSLSGRWGSSSTPNFSPPLSAAAMAANVYVVNNAAGQEFYCTARARMGSGSTLGSLYYSRTAIRTAGGAGLISVAYGSDWAGTMESNQSLTLRSLDLECRIPPNSSGIYAYKVRICQQNSACYTNGQADGEALTTTSEGDSSGWDSVQTSGIECVTGHNTSNRAQRSENGMKNTSTTSWVGVYCPVSQPADDTFDIWRRLEAVRVYYSGGSGPPLCQLTWRDRYPSLTGVTAGFWSSGFVADQTTSSAVVMPESTLVRWDVSTVVWCDVRPGQTIKGITARMTVGNVIDAT